VARDSPRHPLYPAVADRALHRCEYCLAPEEFSGKGFQVEHIIPQPGAAPTRWTTWRWRASGATCKAAAQLVTVQGEEQAVPLFNPRTDEWSACFTFVLVPDREAVLIEGINAIGRATAQRLRMNVPHATRARWKWFLAYALEIEFDSAE
jgi:hypothetical protein